MNGVFISLLTILTMLLFSPHAHLQAQAQTTIPTPTPTSAPAETSKLRVFEKGTKKALSGVHVFFLPQKLKLTTNREGLVEVKGLDCQFDHQSECEMVVNHSGYQKYTQKFTALDLDFKIYLEKLNLFETTVVAKKQTKDDVKKTLTQAEFLSTPGSGGDPVKAIQNLPGINRDVASSARVIIQGAAPSDTRYTINGQTVPNVFHFGGLSSVVLSEAVESIDFLASGYGPEYGRALGGIVGLNIRSPKKDRRHSLFFVDIFNSGGSVEGPLENGDSYLLSARYSYISLVLGSLAKDNPSMNLVVAPTFFDITGVYEHNLGANEKVVFTALTAQDEMSFVLKQPSENDPFARGKFYLRNQFFRFIPNYEKSLDEKRKMKLSAGIGQDKNLVEVADTYVNISVSTLSLRGEVEHSLLSSSTETNGWSWTSTYGMDNEFYLYNAKVKIPDSFSEGGIRNPSSSAAIAEVSTTGNTHVFGFYLRNELKPNWESPWTFLPNLRLDYVGWTKEKLLQPRLALNYKWDSATSLRLATGVYNQPPTAQQVDDTFGNPAVTSERALHLSAGGEREISPGWTVTTGVFYKKLDNLVIRSNRRLERNGVWVAENYNNQGIGRIHGLELQQKWNLQPWTLIGAYTYSQSFRQSPGEPEFPTAQDQTHNLNLMASYESQKWLFSGRGRYVTGSPFTPVESGVMDADNDVFVPIRGPLFSGRKPHFAQVDLRIDRKWIYDEWIWSGYLDIQNIFNQKNIEGIDYSYDYSQRQDITGLPTLATLGIKGEF